jgi:hypothetical protein
MSARFHAHSIAVYALFRSDVRIIDVAKRAALAQLLADNVVSTAPGEKLDEKLAALTFHPEINECGSLSLSSVLQFHHLSFP